MTKPSSPADFSEWSLDEKKQLLDSVVNMAGSSKKSYKASEASIKWEEVKLDGRSSEDCRDMYHFLMSHVRKYRTMPEMIEDALIFAEKPAKPLKLPDKPKKPITAFSLFVRKKAKKFPEQKGMEGMKVFAKEWNNLSEKKKEVYKKKYLKLKDKYQEELEVFRQNHPEYVVSRPNLPQPSKLFIESRLNKLQSKNPELSHNEVVQKLTEKYKKLSDTKKLKWITKADNGLMKYQQECECYLAQNPNSKLKPPVLHLSKEEQKIWNSAKGKPASLPPKNLFMYFCNAKRADLHHLTIAEQSKKLSSDYQKLTGDEKVELTLNFKQEVEDYVQGYTQYYQSLSETERSREKSLDEALAVYHKILENVPKKKKKKQKQPEKKKVTLQSILPQPNNDSESDDTTDSDSSITPPSSQLVSSQGSRESAKQRKGKQSNSEADITKGEQLFDEDEDAAEVQDELLSMWSPSKPLNAHKRKNLEEPTTHKRAKRESETHSSQNSEESSSPSKKTKPNNDKFSAKVDPSASGTGSHDGKESLLSMWSPIRSRTEDTQHAHAPEKQHLEIKNMKKSRKPS